MRQLKVYRSGVGSSQKYRSGHPDGDRYFHFRALYQRWRHKEDVVLHQDLFCKLSKSASACCRRSENVMSGVTRVSARGQIGRLVMILSTSDKESASTINRKATRPRTGPPARIFFV